MGVNGCMSFSDTSMWVLGAGTISFPFVLYWAMHGKAVHHATPPMHHTENIYLFDIALLYIISMMARADGTINKLEKAGMYRIFIAHARSPAHKKMQEKDFSSTLLSISKNKDTLKKLLTYLNTILPTTEKRTLAMAAAHTAASDGTWHMTEIDFMRQISEWLLLDPQIWTQIQRPPKANIDQLDHILEMHKHTSAQ
jgi:tellurite resistance protein